MFNRRKFLRSSLLGSLGLATGKRMQTMKLPQTMELPGNVHSAGSPIVVSTWNIGLEANRAAWQVLNANGEGRWTPWKQE